jgi:hypothetical protein
LRWGGNYFARRAPQRNICRSFSNGPEVDPIAVVWIVVIAYWPKLYLPSELDLVRKSHSGSCASSGKPPACLQIGNPVRPLNQQGLADAQASPNRGDASNRERRLDIGIHSISMPARCSPASITPNDRSWSIAGILILFGCRNLPPRSRFVLGFYSPDLLPELLQLNKTLGEPAKRKWRRRTRRRLPYSD